MTLDQYAAFLSRRGFSVLQIGDVYWLKVAPFFYSGVLPFLPIAPQEDEVRRLRRTRALLGVWYACVDGVMGSVADLSVQDASYSLDSLEQKARNQTRRGLERCRVDRVDFDRLEQCGLQINTSALARQRRASVHRDLVVGTMWKKRMRACANTPDFSAWCAFVENRVAAYAICLKVGSCGIIQSTMSPSEYLKYYPNNALIYTVTTEFFAAGATSVHYGLASDDPHLVRFKQNMGFARCPVPYRLDMNPLVFRLAHLSRKVRHYFPSST